MKSSSKLPVQKLTLGQLWAPEELAGVADVQAKTKINADEVLQIFAGDLPHRPAAAPRGPSGLRTNHDTMAWRPGELDLESPIVAEVVAPVQVQVVKPANLSRPVEKAPEPPTSAELLALRDQATAALVEAEQTRAEAEAGLAEARRQAQQILADAQAEAEQLQRQAYETGKAQGEAEFASGIATLKELFNQASAWREQMLAETEPVVVDMVKDIARSLFSDGINVANEVLQETFSRALTRARNLGDLKIFVSPADAMILDPAWRDFQVTISGQRIQIVPTEGVKPGGCFIEGDHGAVDARIDTRLNAVMAVFDTPTEE